MRISIIIAMKNLHDLVIEHLVSKKNDQIILQVVLILSMSYNR